MRMYLSLADIYNPEPMRNALERMSRLSVGTAELFYIFVSEYARECLESVVRNKCHGIGFLTYTRPDISKVLQLLRQSGIPTDTWIELKDNIDEWWKSEGLSEDSLIRAQHLLQLAEAARANAGLTYEAFAESVKVKLEMNEIRTAYILVEV